MKDFSIEEFKMHSITFVLNLILNLKMMKLGTQLVDSNYKKYEYKRSVIEELMQFYIDYDEIIAIHFFFNCKYAEDFKYTKELSIK